MRFDFLVASALVSIAILARRVYLASNAEAQNKEGADFQ
jgi:hypothetical protein